MKKLILGGLLFAMGMFGVIVIIAAAIASPWTIGNPAFRIEPIDSWLSVIIDLKALMPLVLFGLMGFMGLYILVREVLRKDKR